MAKIHKFLHQPIQWSFCNSNLIFFLKKMNAYDTNELFQMLLCFFFHVKTITRIVQEATFQCRCKCSSMWILFLFLFVIGGHFRIYYGSTMPFLFSIYIVKQTIVSILLKKKSRKVMFLFHQFGSYFIYLFIFLCILFYISGDYKSVSVKNFCERWSEKKMGHEINIEKELEWSMRNEWSLQRSWSETNNIRFQSNKVRYF